MDTGPSRTERRKARTTAAILDAAEQAFRDRGYEATAVEGISEAADVGIGTIYRHFGSKGGLYLAVVERALDADEEFVARAYAEPGSPLERVRAAGDAYVRFYLERPELFRMLAFPAPLPDEAVAARRAERIAERVARMNGRLAELIGEAVAAGELRPIDPGRTATVLWASWNGIISLAWRGDALAIDRDELLALLEVATDLLTAGALPASR